MSAPSGFVKEKSCAGVNTFLLVLPSNWTSFKRSGDDKDDHFHITYKKKVRNTCHV